MLKSIIAQALESGLKINWIYLFVIFGLLLVNEVIQVWNIMFGLNAIRFSLILRGQLE